MATVTNDTDWTRDELHDEFNHYFACNASDECIEYVKGLLRAGWSNLGDTSCYGIVLSHPDNEAFVKKIAYRPKDDGWVPFAKHVLQNPSIHFPTIYSLIEHDTFVEADLEFLQEIGGSFHFSHTTSSASLALGSEDEQRSAMLLRELDVPLAQALQGLRKEFLGSWRIDLHSGNFMRRGETLIVNDPIAYRVGAFGP